MVVPVIPAIILGSMAVSSGASIYAGWKNVQYQKSAMAENNRFWSEYAKNTGVKPRFPYRSGSVYNTSSLYNSYSSIVRAHTSIVGNGAGMYGHYHRNEKKIGNDWLYW